MMCQLCGKQPSDPVSCTGCGALFYCSHAHRLTHSRLCHAEECSRMAAQMSRSEVQLMTLMPLPHLSVLLLAQAPADLWQGDLLHTLKARVRSCGLSQQVFSTPFPWTPAYADAEAVEKLVEDHGGRTTPIWQAECPQCAEEGSDDLWRAALEPWPNQEDSCTALWQATELWGLPEEMVPSLSQPVRPAQHSSYPASLQTINDAYCVRNTCFFASGTSCTSTDIRHQLVC